ncbi:MAG TPA: SPOR domain-containing protein [Ghiorsea sp.]|nr:SPOR domain-containing protein [Ghiorsea sp.]HIP06258.1 SPOR domain-containing protein [Mariprofundaceae bacterium]
MGDKDFAQVETAYFEHHDAKNTSNRAIIITALATFFAIACFAIGFYMGEQHGIEASKGNKHDALIAKLQNQQQELTKLKEETEKWQQQEANTSQIGQLTFYNELPDQSINPEPLDNQPKITNNTAFLDKLEADLARAKDSEQAMHSAGQRLEDIINAQMNNTTRTFRIQVASFSTQQDAKNFIPKLQGLGIAAEVRRVEIPNKGTYFRVFTGSYMNEQDAMRAKQLIKDKFKLDGLMIQNG